MLRLSNRTFKCTSNYFDLFIYNNSKCTRSVRFASTTASVNKSSKRPSILLGVLAGIGLGAGYTFYNLRRGSQEAILNPLDGGNCVVLDRLPPNIEISRKVRYARDDSGLEFVLFQYPTCPFCCKVRAYLDGNGFSYDVVEVNPIMKQQVKWSSYKKVPILLVKTPKGEYVQLNDSTVIISVISSYLLDKKVDLQQIANFYPATSYKDESGNIKSEVYNRYFLMYQGQIPRGETKETIEDLRKWRRWADDVLVHTLSPNVYRTRQEAIESFNWFSEVGEWSRLFSTWEIFLINNIGANAMWIIGKRLKKRYNLKDDVRESLYDSCKLWLKEVNSKGGKFHGGSKPDLADLAVYGVLSSIEGCQAFGDLTRNTKISSWYSAVKESLHSHQKLS